MLGVRRSVVLVVMGAAVSATLLACASGSSAPGSTSTTVPEDRRSTPAEVKAGLAKINAISSDAAGAVADDPDRAVAIVDQVQAAWLLIEGTIKQNDPYAYLSFEDGIALLRAAVEGVEPDTASRAVADLASLTDAYLEQHHP